MGTTMMWDTIAMPASRDGCSNLIRWWRAKHTRVIMNCSSLTRWWLAKHTRVRVIMNGYSSLIRWWLAKHTRVIMNGYSNLMRWWRAKHNRERSLVKFLAALAIAR